VLSGCSVAVKPENENKKISTFFNNEKSSKIVESCFSMKDTQLKIFKGNTTPSDFLIFNPIAISAINGVYWAADTGEPQGVAYTFEKGDLASGTGRVSGYLILKNNEIKVIENLKQEIQKYDFVIGTFPILTINGVVNSQAKEERYNNYLAFRSAIGTKTGNNVCFAVSQDVISMEMWADLLVENNYKDTINLDGGGSSQLAIRDKGTFGGGSDPSKIIIYTQNR